MGRFVSGAAVAALMMLCCAGPALAEKTHPFVSSFGSFNTPGSIAVDDASGDVYVLDAGDGTVQRFDASGDAEDFTAGADAGTNALTGFAFDGAMASQVAVDNSGGASAGNVYVANMAGVDVYASDGSHLGQLTQANGTGFAVEACGVAVDDAGTVYVADFGGTVDRYVPAADPVVDGDYDAQITGVLFPCQLAADSTGAVYTSAWGGGALIKYDAGQFGAGSPSGTTIVDSAMAFAVDLSSDDLYIDDGTQIIHRDAAGVPVTSFGAEQLTNSVGLAVNGSTGQVYVSDQVDRTVSIFGAAVDLPDVTTGAASNVTALAATASATVNPHGSATTFGFEYGTTTAYGSTAPTASAGAGTSAVPVTADLTGLAPLKTYHYRVTATSYGVTVVGSDQTVRTLGPLAGLGEVTDLTTTSATFHGTIDARQVPGATYHFAVNSSTSPYAGATPELSVPAGAGSVAAAASIGDLPPGETFSLRLVVTAGGATVGSELGGFATPAAPPYIPMAPPAIAAQPYGCAAPHLSAIDGHPSPGDSVTVTGTDLGIGGAIAVGATAARTSAWSASGITFTVPDQAVGTLPVTIDCGTASNTVGLVVFQEPDSRFTVTKTSVSGNVATLSIKTPGPGKLGISGKNAVSVNATIKKASTTKVRITLSRAGSAALRKAKSRRLTVSVRVQFTPVGGHSRSQAKVMTFKRKASR